VGLFGVRGAVKVQSHTDPLEALLDYPEWQLDLPGGPIRGQLKEGRPHGRQLVVSLEGFADCDAARRLIGADIRIPRSELPAPEAGEYYRVDLIGLKVTNEQGEVLGRVSHFIETHPNAHPIMVVMQGKTEHWVPATAQHIRRVDLAGGVVQVDWTPE
jgi:16S rRNA processing protein RimM